MEISRRRISTEDAKKKSFDYFRVKKMNDFTEN